MPWLSESVVMDYETWKAVGPRRVEVKDGKVYLDGELSSYVVTSDGKVVEVDESE